MRLGARLSMADKKRKQTLWELCKSLGSLLFGVQSEKGADHDFANGRPLAYIIGGLIAVGLFVGTLLYIATIVSR